MTDASSDDEDDDSRTGEVIGDRYELATLIGRGGHGDVYRAHDMVDKRDVAIKILAAHLARDQDYRVRLVREARAMSMLAGRGTVEIYAVMGADDGTPCLVMELLTGHDLGQELKNRVADKRLFSPAEMTELFMPVVETLDAAHARNIVHRDIKPSNIFLAGGQISAPRIMDFGLAKSGDLAAITADRMLAGSPSYIAPEIWMKGARSADARSDVYSLTVVMFEALTGDVPIWRQGLAQMLIAVTTEKRPSLRGLRGDLPDGIDDWCEQALAINPDHRFQSVVAMWRAFRAVIQL